MKEHYEIYQKRQAIVEHPFGTIKRQWDFSYIMTKKGKLRASADIGLIFSAYNLRRILNLIDRKVLGDWLKATILSIFNNMAHFKPNTAPIIFKVKSTNEKFTPLIAA